MKEEKSLQAPIPKEIPKILEKHGHERQDPYYWLNQREDQEVIQYLEKENEFLEQSLAHLQPLREELFKELKGRIKEKDSSVPLKMGDYEYWLEYKEGQEYPIRYRKHLNSGKKEIRLDENIRAEGKDYYQSGNCKDSPNDSILAFSEDTVGRRIYTIRFRRYSDHEFLKDEIEGTTGSFCWAEDNKTIFYNVKDSQTLRSYRVMKHKLGTDPKEDQVVYEEKDPTFSCYVYKSKSNDFIFIASYSTLSTEYRYLDSNDPDGNFNIFLKREEEHEYSIMHHKDEEFYIRSNWNAQNFKILKTSLKNSESKDLWTEVIPHRKDVFLEDFDLFKDHLVLEERIKGLIKLRVLAYDKSEDYHLEFPESAYAAYIGSNAEISTSEVRYMYSSLTTPWTTYDYNLETKERRLRKQQEIMDPDFDSDNYLTKRLWAPSRDGKKIPISIVYKKDFIQNGNAPLMLYGYGSYGAVIDASFRSSVLSLLDRGFAFAIAHIRGGAYLGREWYEDGKMLKKKNTFYDFIDAGNYLVKEKYTRNDNMAIMGGSAGGLLIGAVINEKPDLAKAAVASVPFVDVVTTMLDESIPLTTGEYDEWGNPNDKEYYEYILSYSPYDNVANKEYPALLVTTGLHDSQVQYWEPAKWVAKLRKMKKGSSSLYLYTDMKAGHSGASGRFEYLKDIALDYAFIIDELEVSK